MAVILKTDMRDAPLDELSSQIAMLKVSGLGINSIVKQIQDETGWPITRTYIERRIETHDMYLKTVRALQDGIIKKNVQNFKQKSSEYLELVSKVLLQALEKGDLKAVPYVLKGAGLDLPEQEVKQAQQITVVMPGIAKPVKEVT